VSELKHRAVEISLLSASHTVMLINSRAHAHNNCRAFLSLNKTTCSIKLLGWSKHMFLGPGCIVCREERNLGMLFKSLKSVRAGPEKVWILKRDNLKTCLKNSGIIACFQVLLVCTRRHVLRDPLLYARALKTSPGPLLKFERGVSFYYLTILWFIGYFSRGGYSLLTEQKL